VIGRQDSGQARLGLGAAVYLDPPEDIRRSWKVRRDTAERGYTAEQVLAELERREPESAAFIRPQRAFAGVRGHRHQVRPAHRPPWPFPFTGRPVPAGTPLSAELLLRPAIRHPDLDGVVPDGTVLAGPGTAIHLWLARDADGRALASSRG